MHSNQSRSRLGGPELLMVVGSALFVFALAFSAWFEADIRWLHFFQAWMYVVATALALRRNRWGWFVGLSAAAFWDYTSLFVTSFFTSGLHWLAVSIGGGRLQRADQIVAVPAWIGNLLAIVGALRGYGRSPEKSRRDWARFGVALVLTTGFFAADMAIFQPRYLLLFGRLLHPHSPFSN